MTCLSTAVLPKPQTMPSLVVPYMISGVSLWESVRHTVDCSKHSVRACLGSCPDRSMISRLSAWRIEAAIAPMSPCVAGRALYSPRVRVVFAEPIDVEDRAAEWAVVPEGNFCIIVPSHYRHTQCP